MREKPDEGGIETKCGSEWRSPLDGLPISQGKFEKSLGRPFRAFWFVAFATQGAALGCRWGAPLALDFRAPRKTGGTKSPENWKKTGGINCRRGRL
jgi:hypothetical protein